MGEILETLAPLALLIALGSALAHLKFLGATFIADLNKLAFWIALPALIFTSAAEGADAGAQTWRLLAVMIILTLLVSFLGWAASYALRLPSTSRGTFVQAAFRGNLAYIGLPVVANSFHALPGTAGPAIMTSAVIVIVLVMSFYNILAVVVLQASQHSVQKVSLRQITRSIATNPLMLSGLLGLVMPLLHLALPDFLQHSLQLLGTAAIPLALLCIGGSLVMVPLRGKLSAIIAGALMKTVLSPAIAYGLGYLAGLGREEMRICLVLSACPTAAAAFVMARQLGGDEALASGSIALSTLLSAISLAVALWLGS